MLAQIIAIRLRQLEAQSPDVESFIAKLGVGRGTFFDLLRGQGNPTLRTIEKVAARLDQSLFDLVGLTDAEVRRATKRVGIDYDELKAALAERKTADSRITAAMTPQDMIGPGASAGNSSMRPSGSLRRYGKRVRLRAGAAKAATGDTFGQF